MTIQDPVRDPAPAGQLASIVASGLRSSASIRHSTTSEPGWRQTKRGSQAARLIHEALLHVAKAETGGSLSGWRRSVSPGAVGGAKEGGRPRGAGHPNWYNWRVGLNNWCGVIVSELESLQRAGVPE
jgi:hypothetical protein